MTVKNDIAKMRAEDEVINAVCCDLINRSILGVTKYGTTLGGNKGDLRYWLNHAYQECLDQANYLKRAIMEIDNSNSPISEPIPDNVYWNPDSCNFYSSISGLGMGHGFCDIWHARCTEFPKVKVI